MNRLFTNAKVHSNQDYTPWSGRVEIDDNGMVVVSSDGLIVVTHISNVTIFANAEVEPATNGHIHCTLCDEPVPTAEYPNHVTDYHQLDL